MKGTLLEYFSIFTKDIIKIFCLYLEGVVLVVYLWLTKETLSKSVVIVPACAYLKLVMNVKTKNQQG